MRAIELLCVGRLKFKELQPLEEMFVRRIKGYLPFSLVQLKDIGLNDEQRVRDKEAEKIIRHLNRDDTVVGLDEGGKPMTSIGFSGFLSEQLNRSHGRIVFIIGGFSGLAPRLDSHIDQKISFSRMTFPHDIFRILFLEQLYRAITIMKGVTYHR